MNTLLHIRKNVLGTTQADMAAIAGTTQATVSRWESGGLQPDREQMSRIRLVAQSRGIEWDDALFFDAPAPRQEQGSAAA